MKRLIQGMVWLVALVALVACQAPVGGPSGGGSLTVSLTDGVSRNLTPTLNMAPASYNLNGSGPGGATFSQDVAGASATLTSLAFGSWSVVVTAKNATGTAIGTGSGTVVVHSNTSASLSVTVTPYAGTGTLSLTTNWTAADVDVAQVEANLLPATGMARTLGFTVDGATGTASFSATDVTTGYHTLTLKLLDNGALVMGAVEVARILKDQTTTGVYQFTNVNKATGSLTVNVTAAMGDPLTVSLAGASATLSQGSTQNLTASVAEAGVNAVYVWYVNGVAVGTGATYVFGANQPLGTYRIDVTAYSADGTMAGSGTTTVGVVAITGFQGMVDIGFGSNGAVSSVGGLGMAVAVQPDSKIVEAGTSVVRYLSNGQLDGVFGTGGVAACPFPSGWFTSLVIQPDGKILAAGTYSNQSFGVVRYLPNGTLDPSFGNGGIAYGNLSGGCSGMALQPDGKIVLCGATYTAATSVDFASIRYLPNGTVDTGYGTNGIVTTDFGTVGGGRDNAMAGVKILGDGAILLGGRTQNGPDNLLNYAFGVVKYTSAGILDASFGNGGKAIVPLGLDLAGGRGMCVDAAGRIILVGEANTIPGQSYSSFAVVRLTTDGHLDPGFANAGTLVVPLGGTSTYATAVTTLPDNTIAVSGAIGDSTIPDSPGSHYANISVLFLASDGSAKPGFGNAGIVTIDLGSPVLTGFSQSITAQADGKLLIAGYGNVNGKMVLARLQ